MPTMELRASYDVRIAEASPNTNFGEERFLAVRNPTPNIQYSLIAFAGLPELGSLITRATLRIFLRGANWSGGPWTITALAIDDRWKESQATFSNQPEVDAGIIATGAVTNGVDGQSVDIDVTAIIAFVMTGGGWHGLRLSVSSGAGVQQQLYSSEAADPALRPLLIIEWSSTPDAPNDMAPSGGKAVSLQKPTFNWQFRDADGDEQSAFQLQIDDVATVDADGAFVGPVEHDTGWIPTSATEFDSSLSGTGGALPTVVTAGTVASGTGDITPGLPGSWAKNDILVLAVENNASDPAPAVPDGYVHIKASPVTTTGTRLSAFWKRATAVESAPTVADTGDHQLARMIGVRGCPTDGFPWENTVASVEAVSDTSGSATGFTTTQTNELVMILAASDFDPGADDTVGYSALTNAALGSLTEQTDNRAAAGNGGTLMIATGTKAIAGAIGNTTYTLANAGNKAHLVIGFTPTTSYGPTWVGITAGATRFWNVRTRDEQGNTSPWSDVQSFTRSAKGALSISSPANGGTVEETTPPIISTLTTRTQESISYRLEQFISADNEWVTVWEQGRRAAPANPGSAYNFGIPAGKITAASTNYRLTVRSWDTQDRDSTPGDPVYVEAQSTFTFARSATPSPVTVLTAAAEDNNGPGVKLTFNRAVGQSSPDFFSLVVDGVRIFDRIDPANIIDGGSPIVYSFVYYGAEPYEQHTFEVEAVTFVTGVLKHSQSNDTEVYTPQPKGIWLQDDDDPPYRPASPPRRVHIQGTVSPSLGIAESAATYRAVGRQDPVTIYDAIGGFEGTVTGRVWATDPLTGATGGPATVKWMKRERNIGRRFRLIATGMSIPVELQAVDTFSPVGDAGAVKAYDVSIGVAQVGEFGEVD